MTAFLPPAAPAAPLKPSLVPLGAIGPAQSEHLAHFCSRPPGSGQSWSLTPDISAMDPVARLTRILQQRSLRGFPPFGAQDPMICLSESPLSHLQWLITQRVFPPWGLLLSRQWVYDVGGAPVWYPRAEEYALLTPGQKRWASRLDTTVGARSDWLHEREWRIPLAAGNDSSLTLPPEALVAIQVGCPNWQLRPGPTGLLEPVPTRWSAWSAHPHWWWNVATQSWDCV